MAVETYDNSDRNTGINWSRAILAGLIATVAITVTLGLFGNNIMKSLGAMILGPGASAGAQYMAGGVMHLMVGLFYGIVYAWFFGPVREWSRFTRGAVFAATITAIALVAMPLMGAMMGGGGAGNPCNPCAGGAEKPPATQAANPCNPCAGKAQSGAQNPCNPCAAKGAAPNPCAAKNPCNPSAARPPQGEAAGSSAPQNPCNPCAAKAGTAPAQNPCNPCAGNSGAGTPNACSRAGANPCNPCGGGGSPYAGLISLINHLVYGLILAFVYGRAS